jgi:tetratricopeptide (TPR) repeat protein
MRARAAWSRIRYFTPHQRFKAARETRSLRTAEVARVVLIEAFSATRNEPKQAEEWASFGIQLLEILSTREVAGDQRRERLGEAYTILGNARRVGHDYQGAAAAIQTAYGHLENNPTAHLADLCSIHASLKDAIGDLEGAVWLIERGLEIYTALRNRHGVGRLKVQHANILRETQPTEARVIAADAILVLPRAEVRLEMLARCIISQSFAETRDGKAALTQLEETRPLISQFREAWLDCRVQFLEALILETLGYIADAERLYREVARLFWLREMYRESFMVRLRLFEFYLRRNRVQEAAEVCSKAVRLLGETDAHAQMKEVWQRLYEAAEAQAIKIEMCPKIRDYMVRHWAVPAERLPGFAAID